MRGTRSTMVLVGTVLALSGQVGAASAAETPYPLHMTKDCSTYTAENPSYCTINGTNLDLIPVGTKVWYSGPELATPAYLSSNVLLDVGSGSQATGYCIFDYAVAAGMCTFSSGTGTLTGFHALLHVSIDRTTSFWTWDGSYYAAHEFVSAPSASNHGMAHPSGPELRPR
jgi:hypothetical protein